MARAIFVLILSLFGCISLKTHKAEKIKSFEAGERDMAERVIKDFESGQSKEEVIFNLKGILDLK